MHKVISKLLTKNGKYYKYPKYFQATITLYIIDNNTILILRNWNIYWIIIFMHKKLKINKN